MSPVRLIILLVAAGAAIGAVFLVRSVQAPSQAAASETAAVVAQPVEEPKKLILVANTAIPVGKFVALDDLRWQEWPADAPTDAFLDKEKAPDALEKMVGAVARQDLVNGEPVTITKLVHPGTSGFMSVIMTPGMRAVSVQIEAETAAGGFIQPNDRVDVIVTREVQDKNGGGGNALQGIRSDVILSNVRVLAIDATYGAPLVESEGETKAGQGAAIIGSRATLELSERDTTLLNTARKAGDISLTLRSIADIAAPSGATGQGRVYRDGVAQDSEGVKVFRYGNETVASATAG